MQRERHSQGGVIILVLFLSFCCLIGCGGGGGGGSNDQAPQESQPGDSTDFMDLEGPPPLDLTTQDGDSVSKLVSATVGDRLEVGELALDIPASALTDDTMVTMTVWRDLAQGPYTLVAMFEPDGLQLNDQALLTIPLDPPLPAGEALNLLYVDSSDPSTVVDTGMLAEVSEDGTEVSIPVEHFCGHGQVLNCHGHSVRNIIWGLLGRGMTKTTIMGQIQATIGDRLVKEPKDPEETEVDFNIRVKQAYEKLEDNYDKLQDPENSLCRAEPRDLLAYLNTFYILADERPNATYNGNLATVIEPMDSDCLDEMERMAQSSDLPPILNFNTTFRVNAQSDAGLPSNGEPVFFDVLAHSAPIIARANGVVIENGTKMEDDVAVALQVGRRDDPEASAEEIPRVIAVDLSKLDRFRGLLAGEGVKEELRRWGADDKIISGAQRTPYGAVRIWIPKGEHPGECGGVDETPDPDCTDADGDGYYAEEACSGDTDCNDSNQRVNPGAVETCDDRVDNDCDRDIDCNDSDCASHESCSVVIESVVWIHEDSRTCCAGDFGGVAPYQYHGTEKENADEGAIILAAFDSQEEMLDWTCDREVHIAYNWIRNWAEIGGYIVTNLPCEANAPWEP